jgi:hypothetical protein
LDEAVTGYLKAERQLAEVGGITGGKPGPDFQAQTVGPLELVTGGDRNRRQ